MQAVLEGSEAAAAKMHFWLERTAFYKVPKSHQDEVAEQCHKPFEQVPTLPIPHGINPTPGLDMSPPLSVIQAHKPQPLNPILGWPLLPTIRSMSTDGFLPCLICLMLGFSMLLGSTLGWLRHGMPWSCTAMLASACV